MRRRTGGPTTSPGEQTGEQPVVKEWYDLGEQLRTSDVKGAEQAYRKAIALSPRPFYAAVVDLGALLCEHEARCKDALHVFDEALSHFPEDFVLHFNRAIAFEELGRLDDIERSYKRCRERHQVWPPTSLRGLRQRTV